MHYELPDTINVAFRDFLPELVENLVTLLRLNDVPDETIRGLVNTALAEVPQPEKMPPPGDGDVKPEVRDAMSSLLALWRSESRFLDPVLGEPSPLPLTGENSLTALFELTLDRYKSTKSLEDLDFDKALALLVDNESIRFEDNKACLVRDDFRAYTVSSGPRTIFLQYLRDAMASFMKNSSEVDNSKRRFTRQTTVPNFPVVLIPQFMGLLEDKGMSFLREIDSYLEEHAGSTEYADSEYCPAGVLVLTFTREDDLPETQPEKSTIVSLK